MADLGEEEGERCQLSGCPHPERPLRPGDIGYVLDPLQGEFWVHGDCLMTYIRQQIVFQKCRESWRLN